MGIGIAHRGVDLGLCESAARLHFRGDELGQRLSGVERVAFLHEEFFDPAAGARGDMHFVDLNRARNRLGARPAGGERRQDKAGDGSANKKLRRLQGAERLPTSC
jgi:hypothetical protein